LNHSADVTLTESGEPRAISSDHLGTADLFRNGCAIEFFNDVRKSFSKPPEFAESRQ
jgi:hypothetical protein